MNITIYSLFLIISGIILFDVLMYWFPGLRDRLGNWASFNLGKNQASKKVRRVIFWAILMYYFLEMKMGLWRWIVFNWRSGRGA